MKQMDHTLAVQEKQGGFLDAYRQVLPAVIRHPATWLLTLLWLLATIYLFALGRITLTGIFLDSLLGQAAIVLLTIPLTQGAPPAAWKIPVPYSRTRLWLQGGLALLSAMFIAFLALVSNLHISIPLLTPFYNLIRTNMLISIVSILFFEIVLPLGLALLLGARWREMGFQKGYHTWRVTALWSSFPALLLVIAIVQGKLTLLAVLGRIVLVFLVAALPEEIAMRGVLMTRLIRLLGTGWGIALSALLFGLLHFGSDIGRAGSTSVLLVLATCIYGQMTGGICFAIALQRTRSLIPGIVSHALSDAAVGLLPL